MKLIILSIDGGGMRGIIPVQFLNYIENKTQKPIHQSFDLMAGTSTGALIVSALSTPQNNTGNALYHTADVEEIYYKHGSQIFPEKNGFLNYIRNLFKPQFSAKGIEKVLKDKFNDVTIDNCLTPVFIPAYDNLLKTTVYFSTRASRPDSFDYSKNYRLRDVCRATAAAPTYLPPYKMIIQKESLEYEADLIDGGVFQNNPAMLAIAEIMKYKDDIPYGRRSNLQLEDIYVLSLGTGYHRGITPGRKSHRWGQIKWAVPLIELMMLGVSQAVHEQVAKLLPKGNYLRLNPSFEQKEKHKMNMTFSSKQTLDYWKNKANDFLDMEKNTLDEFLAKSGIMRKE